MTRMSITNITVEQIERARLLYQLVAARQEDLDRDLAEDANTPCALMNLIDTDMIVVAVRTNMRYRTLRVIAQIDAFDDPESGLRSVQEPWNTLEDFLLQAVLIRMHTRYLSRIHDEGMGGSRVSSRLDAQFDTIRLGVLKDIAREFKVKLPPSWKLKAALHVWHLATEHQQEMTISQVAEQARSYNDSKKWIYTSRSNISERS